MTRLNLIGPVNCHHALAKSLQQITLEASSYGTPWVSRGSRGVVHDYLYGVDHLRQFSQKQQVDKAEAQTGVDSSLIGYATL